MIEPNIEITNFEYLTKIKIADNIIYNNKM